jgi:hypothetical protein
MWMSTVPGTYMHSQSGALLVLSKFRIPNIEHEEKNETHPYIFAQIIQLTEEKKIA